MKQKSDHALVIRRVDYGEKDRIVTVLSAENGRISLLAKSVKSPKSRLSAGIELLSVSEISFIEGRGELKTLTGARLLEHWGNIVTSRQSMQQAFDYLGLVNRISEDNSGQEYYETLVASLAALNDKNINNLIADVWFYVNILEIFGSSPNLLIDVAPDQNKNQKFRFDLDNQQFVSDQKGNFTVDHIKLMRLCLQTSRPPKITKDIDKLDELGTLTRFLVKSHVD